MDVSSLRSIERLNYMLGAILVAGAAILMSRPDVLGVLVGVALSCANFTLMRRMVQWWISTPAERRAPRTLVLLPKMLGIMLAVALAVFFLPVSGIGVLVGFSVFLGSIAIETVRFTLAGPARQAQESPESGASGAGTDTGGGPGGNRQE
jgi:ATP synthase I chain